MRVVVLTVSTVKDNFPILIPLSGGDVVKKLVTSDSERADINFVFC